MTQFDVDVALHADGLISVTVAGFSADPWLGLQAMPVSGGVLHLDARHPGGGIRCLIEAPEIADWLEPLFSAEVTLEVVRLSRLDDPSPQTTTLSITVTPFYVDTVRLIYGLWLRRWWPSPISAIPRIDEWLLDVELGDLAAANEQLFNGAAPAIELLSPHTARLAAALDAYVSVQGANDFEDAIGAVLLSAAASTLGCVDPSIAGFSELDDALRRHDDINDSVGELPIGAAFDFALTELSTVLSASSSPRELAQARDVSTASAGTLASRGSSPLDWLQVHPRSADAGAVAVVWSTFRDATTLTLVIAVPAPLPRPHDRLFARVELIGGRTLAAVLVLQPQGYSAVVTLPDGADHDGLRVTVYSSEFGSGGRQGTSADVVQRVRRMVLATVGARVGDVRRMMRGDQRDGDIVAFAAEKRAIRAP